MDLAAALTNMQGSFWELGLRLAAAAALAAGGLHAWRLRCRAQQAEAAGRSGSGAVGGTSEPLLANQAHCEEQEATIESPPLPAEPSYSGLPVPALHPAPAAPVAAAGGQGEAALPAQEAAAIPAAAAGPAAGQQAVPAVPAVPQAALQQAEATSAASHQQLRAHAPSAAASTTAEEEACTAGSDGGGDGSGGSAAAAGGGFRSSAGGEGAAAPATAMLAVPAAAATVAAAAAAVPEAAAVAAGSEQQQQQHSGEQEQVAGQAEEQGGGAREVVEAGEAVEAAGEAEEEMETDPADPAIVAPSYAAGGLGSPFVPPSLTNPAGTEGAGAGGVPEPPALVPSGIPLFSRFVPPPPLTDATSAADSSTVRFDLPSSSSDASPASDAGMGVGVGEGASASSSGGDGGGGEAGSVSGGNGDGDASGSSSSRASPEGQPPRHRRKRSLLSQGLQEHQEQQQQQGGGPFGGAAAAGAAAGAAGQGVGMDVDDEQQRLLAELATLAEPLSATLDPVATGDPTPTPPAGRLDLRVQLPSEQEERRQQQQQQEAAQQAAQQAMQQQQQARAAPAAPLLPLRQPQFAALDAPLGTQEEAAQAAAAAAAAAALLQQQQQQAAAAGGLGGGSTASSDSVAAALRRAVEIAASSSSASSLQQQQYQQQAAAAGSSGAGNVVGGGGVYLHQRSGSGGYGGLGPAGLSYTTPPGSQSSGSSSARGNSGLGGGGGGPGAHPSPAAQPTQRSLTLGLGLGLGPGLAQHQASDDSAWAGFTMLSERSGSGRSERHLPRLSEEVEAVRSSMDVDVPLACKLDVVSGPCTNRSYTNTEDVLEIVIGRNQGATMQLPDGEISGQHAAVRWSSVDKCWKVADLGSLNGTLLNGEPISVAGRKRGRDYRLSSDDILQLGSFTRIKVSTFPRDLLDPLQSRCGSLPVGSMPRSLTMPKHRIPSFSSLLSPKITNTPSKKATVAAASDELRLECCIISRTGRDHQRKGQMCEDVACAECPLHGSEAALGDAAAAALFCVFDGHCGRSAADAASIALPDEVSTRLEGVKDALREAAGAEDMMRHAFLATDKAINSEEGCTATAVLMWRDGQGAVCLQAANVGDSAALFIDPDSQRALELTEDHRLTNPRERQRLQDMGIQLASNARRLYGLNLCRGLGDKFLKDEDLGLSAEPYVSGVLRLTEEQGGILLIASDGLWDVADAEAVTQAICQADREKDGSVLETTNAVIAYALKQRTKDDVTALVVRVWPASEWELRSPTKNLDDGEAASFVS